MRTIDEALKIFHKEYPNLKAIDAYESERYFVINAADITNSSAFVIDKEKDTSGWIHYSKFPLQNSGKFIRKIDL